MMTQKTTPLDLMAFMRDSQACTCSMTDILSIRGAVWPTDAPNQMPRDSLGEQRASVATKLRVSLTEVGEISVLPTQHG